MKVSSICNKNVITAAEGSSVLEVASLMRQHHVDTIVIVANTPTGEKPIGIVSERDLVIKVLAEDSSSEESVLGDFINRDLICVRDHEDIMETVRIMCMEGVRRVPVVNHDGDLMGILAMDDLFEILANELSNLAMLICRQERNENKLNFQ